MEYRHLFGICKGQEKKINVNSAGVSFSLPCWPAVLVMSHWNPHHYHGRLHSSGQQVYQLILLGCCCCQRGGMRSIGTALSQPAPSTQTNGIGNLLEQPHMQSQLAVGQGEVGWLECCWAQFFRGVSDISGRETEKRLASFPRSTIGNFQSLFEEYPQTTGH